MDWYATRSVLAAERFLDEVERAVALIAEAPERWPPYVEERDASS
jgi:plasmid stabilization system protein ParE